MLTLPPYREVRLYRPPPLPPPDRLPVAIRSAQTQYHAGASLNHGNRDEIAPFAVNLRHSDFAPKQSD